jgi:hypothetical protein
VRKQTYYGAIALLALLVGALAVTNQSLRIDEGSAALKAMEPSLGGWWHNLRSEGNSNLQLIGELFYLWGWEKIFGASEVALRASNIPFFAGGVVALAWGMGPRRVAQTTVVLLALTNAFLWYYLSEARPYIVLFGFASLTAACLLRLVQEPDDSAPAAVWFRLFCAGLIGLCATSLIAVPWALGAIGAFLYWSGPRALGRCALRCKAASGLLIAALAGFGLYYLWTLQLGARASAVGRTGWMNVGFIFYELLGLAGLGPGELDLRTRGPGAMSAFLPLIILGAILALALLLAGFFAVQRRIEKRHVWFFTIAVVLPCVLVFAAGAFGQMRLVGRHLTPLLPFLLALMAAGLASLLSEPALWQRSLAVAMLGIIPISAWQIRLAPRHRRDDYRTVAAIARDAIQSEKQVWWLADVSTGRYYHVPFDSPQLTVGFDPSGPNPPPDLVIFSKPDIYDASGFARPYLAREGFTVQRVVPAFEILTRSPVR